MRSNPEKQLLTLLSKKSSYYLQRFPNFNVKKTRKVILFGAGQMGAIYLNYFNKLGIEVVVFFDNDLGKVGQRINNIPILGTKKLADYPEKTPIIITSIFDEEIFKQLRQVGFKKVWSHAFLATFYTELFPNPYWSNPIEVLLENKENLINTIKLFSDDTSKHVFLSVIKYRLFLDRKYIRKIKSFLKNEYFDGKIISISEKEVFVDGGAYDGDTLIKFIKASKNRYKKIFAFEPDNTSFNVLKKFTKGSKDKRIKIYKYGLAEKNKTIKFTNDGTLGSRFDKDATQEIKAISVDKLLSKENISMIKLDIEGAEMEALIGAEKIIKKNKPKLAICIYHKPDDIWRLPLFMKKLNPSYRFYLRHYSDFLYDTVCYAI